MLIVAPYVCILRSNNWFFDEKNKNFIFSDENITLNKILIEIPFKKDQEYNKKVIDLFKKFQNFLTSKIVNPDNKFICHSDRITFTMEKPITIMVKPIIYNDSLIKIPWEIIA